MDHLLHIGIDEWNKNYYIFKIPDPLIFLLWNFQADFVLHKCQSRGAHGYTNKNCLFNNGG